MSLTRSTSGEPGFSDLSNRCNPVETFVSASWACVWSDRTCRALPDVSLSSIERAIVRHERACTLNDDLNFFPPARNEPADVTPLFEPDDAKGGEGESRDTTPLPSSPPPFQSSGSEIAPPDGIPTVGEEDTRTPALDAAVSAMTDPVTLAAPDQPMSVVSIDPLSPMGTSEGGKEGGPLAAVSASPPSPPPIASNSGHAPIAIYRPAPDSNPVLAALRREGLYGSQAGKGRHRITCPWAAEHAAEGVNATYLEPAGNTPLGQFECPPCRQRNRHIGTLLDHLGIEAVAARCKPVIRSEKGEFHQVVDAAEKVLATAGAYYHSGGQIISLRSDPFTNETSTQLVGDQAAMVALSAAADWENFDGRSKSWQRVDVPTRVVTALMKKGQHRYLRPLNGIARQPFFRVGDDALVNTAGYDTQSGMFAAFDQQDYNLPESSERNARDALDGLKHLISEFHFATPNDKSAALSAMLAGAIRPSLRLCPAFSISASRPGSGKSYLAAVIGRLAGPSDTQNTSYPTNAEEASKLVLSLMLTSPAVVCFDDMTSDWMAYGAINRLLTSETITERVLGASKTATARTASLIMGTGNNIRPLRDLARRVVSIYLSPRVEAITSLRYKGNPLASINADRKRYVGYALTIVSAYIAAGRPRADVPTVPSYDDWSRLCRDSLIWLGEPDPAASLLAQVNEDPDVQAFGDLLVQWHACFRDRPTMVRTLLDRAEQDAALKEALLDLPVVERGFVNRSKFGRYLARHANRIVNGHELRQSPNGERNAWVVVATDDGLKDQPLTDRERAFDPGLAFTPIAPRPGGAAPGEVY